MIQIECWICQQELTAPGALLFGVPLENGWSRKHHICHKCYTWMLKQLGLECQLPGGDHTSAHNRPVRTVRQLPVYDSRVEEPLRFTPETDAEPSYDPRDGNPEYWDYDRNGFAPGGWE